MSRILKPRLTSEVSIVAEGDSVPTIREGSLDVFDADTIEVTGFKARRTAGSVLPPTMWVYTRTGQDGTGGQYRVCEITPSDADIDIVFAQPIQCKNEDDSVTAALYVVIDNTQGATSTWSCSLRLRVED